ncbi:MAG: OmpA family protein [Myxococcota bacterium]
MLKHSRLSLVCALLVAPAVQAQVSQVASPSESAEKHLSTEDPFMFWGIDPTLLEREAGDRLVQREVVGEQAKTVKLKNVIPPIHFESGVANIPTSYIERLRRLLDGMRQLENVRLHLIGHADDQPLSDRLSGVYGDNAGLSRERAGEVGEFIQTALALPPDAISFEWAGERQPIATNTTAEGRARNRRVEVEVWYDESESKLGLEEVVVPADIKRVKVCRTETVCKLRYLDGHARRARVRNLIAPLHYSDETVGVPPEFVRQIGQALHNLAGKQNVTVKFIGYSDDLPLTGRSGKIYGTHLALSKARAHRVALAIQDALDLPSSALASDGRGATQPLASNETARGRTLNRRVEVEFWHDDPLQELPDEPQPCPEAPAAEVVTKVYDPTFGALPALQIEAGQVVIPPGYSDALRRALDEVHDKARVRLRFTGHTRNERLDRRTALVYGDDIGLSAARARRAMEKIKTELGLSDAQAEHEGRGYVHSNDVVNTGFLPGETSDVAVEVVYDELAVLDENEGVDVTPLTRELRPKNPLGLNLMRITVDGEPIDDPGRSSADVQRCTDVALERANIRFGFDNLESERRLSVSSSPSSIRVPLAAADDDPVPPVRFRMYSNYAAYIERSEVRIFAPEQSLEAEPLVVIGVEPDGFAEWQPALELFAAPQRELRYLLRAYGVEGQFDETEPRPLWMLHEDAPRAQPSGPPQPDESLAGYGESALAVKNIPLGSGTVKIEGEGVPREHTVWLAGEQVPVDANGNFVAETILPSGTHTVEVAVLDAEGNGDLFLRDLEFEGRDWFYVAMSDLTLSTNSPSSEEKALAGENAPYEIDSNADGRFAFFVDGKLTETWGLTASADTREGPVDQLFSNFMDKSPESLFRRIDPDYFYPTYGDDGTVEEMAPTQGKFFAKLSNHDNHALWGNFKVGYVANELAPVDRALYGGNLHYQSDTTTSFGEQRMQLDGFAAEPGTVPSREEFRATGGSVYFLRRQDILTGSDRVRIETRDPDSGLVTGVVHLRPGLDYDFDYFQGRVLLSEPLTSTAGGSGLLVRSGGVAGDEAWLVVQYEFTPGFEEMSTVAAGGQGHYWLADFAKLGLTANKDTEGDGDSNLYGVDLTLRQSAESWLKVQTGKRDGMLSTWLSSDDGGFDFAGSGGLGLVDANADAYRADLSIGMGDLFSGSSGRVTLYAQNLDAGYSTASLLTLTDTQQFGGALMLPLTDRLRLAAKADSRTQTDGLDTQAGEIDLGYQLTDRWSLGAGVRHDNREDNSLIVPVTQEEGGRTDAALQLGYDSTAAWRSYGFVQSTLAADGNREENGRVGVGGAYRVTDRLVVDAEASAGQLGPGGKLGTSYQATDRTTVYVNYGLEDERGIDGLYGRRSNLIAGARTRLSQSSSIYLENRYQTTDTRSGLTHATGVNLTPTDRWNLGSTVDVGTLVDRETGAETRRKAGGLRIGYGFEKVQLASGFEYRLDDTEQLDGSWADRTTYLFRNNGKYQVTPDWRFVLKLNHALSDSSLGEFYDGGYTEGVLGWAYRPVAHDRLNVLAKYTYFYNVPTLDQFNLREVADQFLQRSHIASLDLTYDLTSRLTIGGKYAYRMGSVSLDRVDTDFFDNDAHLYVLHTDWRFMADWEATMELRLLDLPSLSDSRSGALLGVYRHVGDHMKVGVGYNFTDFSDDLTDLSYDHHGFFINFNIRM